MATASQRASRAGRGSSGSSSRRIGPNSASPGEVVESELLELLLALLRVQLHRRPERRLHLTDPSADPRPEAGTNTWIEFPALDDHLGVLTRSFPAQHVSPYRSKHVVGPSAR